MRAERRTLQGLNLTTLRPELKPEVGCLVDCATQAPLLGISSREIFGWLSGAQLWQGSAAYLALTCGGICTVL